MPARGPTYGAAAPSESFSSSSSSAHPGPVATDASKRNRQVALSDWVSAEGSHPTPAQRARTSSGPIVPSATGVSAARSASGGPAHMGTAQFDGPVVPSVAP